MVGEIVWRPVNTPVDKGDRVDLSKPSLFGEVFLGEVKDDGEAETDGESDQGEHILTSRTEHPDWTKSSPEYGSGEEGVDTRAGHFEGSGGSANSLDLVHLEVEDSDANEGGDHGSDQLSTECMPGRDLEVVTEFEILREGKSLSGGDVSEGFEVVHCQRISSDPRTTDLPISTFIIFRNDQTHEFSQDIHGDLQSSDGPNDPHWNHTKGTEDDTVYYDSRSGVCLPQPNTETTAQDGETENGEIPDLSNIRVDRHESIMNIGESGHSATPLEHSFEYHCTDISLIIRVKG